MGTTSTLLAEHVTLRVRSVDRLWIAGYLPELTHEGGLVSFLLHRVSLIGTRNIPSPAVLTKNHDRMVDDLDSLVERLELPVVRFKAKESKESIARPFQLALADEGTEGLVLVGKAQERQSVWVGYKDDTSELGTEHHPHFSFRASRGCPTRGTSTSGTTSGYRRSSSWAPMPPIHCSPRPTATNGSSASSTARRGL